jgi:hypothetical protein
MRENSYGNWLVEFAKAGAAVANYCDHVEHNEPAERSWVLTSASTLRRLAAEIARAEGEDLRGLYAARLRQVEQRNPAWSPGELDGAALAEAASSWRELQLAQLAHDRRYHPDIVGLSKADQLRHCALHVAKLTGALAEISCGELDREDFVERRVPDMLLFGLKLATLCGERLEDEALGASGQPLELVAG